MGLRLRQFQNESGFHPDPELECTDLICRLRILATIVSVRAVVSKVCSLAASAFGTPRQLFLVQFALGHLILFLPPDSYHTVHNSGVSASIRLQSRFLSHDD